MSKIKRCQNKYLKWCNVNSFKGLHLSRDKADDINVGGNILYGCIGIFLYQEVSWFISIIDMPFFVIRCLHEMCANGIACNCFILAFGLVVLGFTNANWYAQLRYSKVMITEIVEGPFSINNIDLYSNYSGNKIVSLNLSFLVLTCKAILWQKSNLSNHKESCSMFVMNLRFTFFFFF